MRALAITTVILLAGAGCTKHSDRTAAGAGNSSAMNQGGGGSSGSNVAIGSGGTGHNGFNPSPNGPSSTGTLSGTTQGSTPAEPTARAADATNSASADATITTTGDAENRTTQTGEGSAGAGTASTGLGSSGNGSALAAAAAASTPLGGTSTGAVLGGKGDLLGMLGRIPATPGGTSATAPTASELRQLVDDRLGVYVEDHQKEMPAAGGAKLDRRWVSAADLQAQVGQANGSYQAAVLAPIATLLALARQQQDTTAPKVTCDDDAWTCETTQAPTVWHFKFAEVGGADLAHARLAGILVTDQTTDAGAHARETAAFDAIVDARAKSLASP